MRQTSFFKKATAIFVCVSLLLSNNAIAASLRTNTVSEAIWFENQITSSPSAPRNDTTQAITIPSELGRIEESYTPHPNPLPGGEGSLPTGQAGVREKTIIYIQDAHDSLEAQENIARLIHYFVEHYGVKTVFEEGYEGPVPTDEYFGFIKDPQIKEKVSYFLLDKLRIGGAEYAHINRPHPNPLPGGEGSLPAGQAGVRGDFKLIGADNIKLHLENIRWYQKSAKRKEETGRDLVALQKEIDKLANRYFPKELKEWMKLKKRFDEKQIPLVDYLKRIIAFVPSLRGVKRRSNPGSEIASATAWPRNDIRGYPAIILLLQTENAQDKSVIEQVKQIDPKTLFEEIDRLENDIAKSFLAGERDQQIFHYHKSLALLKRLNDIQLTPSEYEVIQKGLREVTKGYETLRKVTQPHGTLRNLHVTSRNFTEELAQFIVEHTKKSIVLSKRWEQNIQRAIQFYEIAQGRDKAIEHALIRHSEEARRGDEESQRSFSAKNPADQDDASSPAVLVFGGFHKERIKEILRKQGYSYVIVSPKISEIDPRHQDYYKRLMSVGYHSFEKPFLAATASRPRPLIGFPRSEVRTEIQAIYQEVLRLGDKPLSILFSELERELTETSRAEVRASKEEIDLRNLLDELSLKPVEIIESINVIDLRVEDKIYLLQKNPTLQEIESLLQSRQREYGVYGLSIEGRPYLLLEVGRKTMLIHGGELSRAVQQKQDKIKFLFRLHNHPLGKGFPSPGDLGNNLILDDPESMLGLSRNFIYVSRSARLIEFGVLPGGSSKYFAGKIEEALRSLFSDIKIPSETKPRGIKLQIWKKGEEKVEESFIPNTHEVRLSLTPSKEAIWAFYGAMRRQGVVQVRVEDVIGNWASWGPRVNLESILKEAGLLGEVPRSEVRTKKAGSLTLKAGSRQKTSGEDYGDDVSLRNGRRLRLTGEAEKPRRPALETFQQTAFNALLSGGKASRPEQRKSTGREALKFFPTREELQKNLIQTLRLRPTLPHPLSSSQEILSGDPSGAQTLNSPSTFEELKGTSIPNSQYIFSQKLHHLPRSEVRSSGEMQPFTEMMKELAEKYNALQRKRPGIIQEVNLGRNALTMIKSIIQQRPTNFSLTPEQEAELRNLAREYQRHLRMTHFVRWGSVWRRIERGERIEDIVDENRMKFLLVDSGGMLLSQRLLVSLIWQYQTEPALDFDVSGFTGGGGPIDAIVDTQSSVSFAYGQFSGKPDSQTGYLPAQLIRDAEIAVVLKEKAQEIKNQIAFNVPDDEYLVGMTAFLGISPEEVQPNLLSPTGLQKVIEELIVSKGLEGVDTEGAVHGIHLDTRLPGFLPQFTPFSDREVKIPEGVGPGFVEAVILSDKLYDTLSSKSWWNQVKVNVIKVSDYFARDREGKYLNPRLRQLEESKQALRNFFTRSEVRNEQPNDNTLLPKPAPNGFRQFFLRVSFLFKWYLYDSWKLKRLAVLGQQDFVREVSEKNADKAARLIGKIGQYGPIANESLPLLTAIAAKERNITRWNWRDEPNYVRVSAAAYEALSKIDPSNPEGMKTIIAGLSSQYSTIVESAKKALIRIGPSVIEKVTNIFPDPDTDINRPELHPETRDHFLEVIESLPIDSSIKHKYRVKNALAALKDYKVAGMSKQEGLDRHKYYQRAKKAVEVIAGLDSIDADLRDAVLDVVYTSNDSGSVAYDKTGRELTLDLLSHISVETQSELQNRYGPNIEKWGRINTELKGELLYALGYPTSIYLRNRLRDSNLSWEMRLKFLFEFATIEDRNPYWPYQETTVQERLFVANEIIKFLNASRNEPQRMRQIIELLFPIMRSEKDARRPHSKDEVPYVYLHEFLPVIAEYGTTQDLLEAQRIILDKEKSHESYKASFEEKLRAVNINQGTEPHWVDFVERINLHSLTSPNGLALFEKSFTGSDAGWTSPQAKTSIDITRSRSEYTGQDFSHLGEKLYNDYIHFRKNRVDLQFLEKNSPSTTRGIVSEPFYHESGYIRLQGDLTFDGLRKFLQVLWEQGVNPAKVVILPKKFTEEMPGNLPERAGLEVLAGLLGVTSTSNTFKKDHGERQVREQVEVNTVEYSEDVKITNPFGVHAKTAIEIAAVVSKYPDSSATIDFHGTRVQASHRVKVLGLNIEQGDTVQISATGKQSRDLVKELVNLFKNQSDDFTPIVYTLENAPLDAEIIGKKGLNLVRMKRMGIPVPPALMIRADRDLIKSALTDNDLLTETLNIYTPHVFKEAERKGSQPLANSSRSVSVRSSPVVSAPGLLDTITDIGKDLWGWGTFHQEKDLIDNARSLRNFGTKVLHMVEGEFDQALQSKGKVDWKKINDQYRKQIKEFMAEHEMPVDEVNAIEQIYRAVLAVKDSRHNRGVTEYLKLKGISGDLPVAVIIQQMVYADLDENSGSFVLSTVDQNTGEEGLFIEYAKGQPGAAIVSGQITPKPLDQSGIGEGPLSQIKEIVVKLQNEFGKHLQIEGVVESGKVYILQARELDVANRAVVDRDVHPTVINTGGVSSVEGVLLKPVDIADISIEPGKKVILAFDHADKKSTAILLEALDRKFPIAGIITQYGGKETHFASIVFQLRRSGYSIPYVSEANLQNLKPGQATRVDLETGIISQFQVSDDQPRSEIRKTNGNKSVIFVDGAAEYDRVQDRAEELAVLAARSENRTMVVYNADETKGISKLRELLRSFELTNIKFVTGPLSEALKPYQFRQVDLVHYSVSEKEALFIGTSTPRWLADRLTRFVGEPGALGYALEPEHFEALKLNKPVEDIQSKNGYHVVSPRASQWMRLLQQARFATVFAQAA